MIPSILTLHGMPLHENPLLTEQEEYTIRRTWKQRLLTRPWRPWRATIVRTRRVPSKQIYALNGAFFAHPETATRIRAMLKEQV